MGRQNVAQSEFELLEGDLSDEERARALRRPQLEAARGQVQAARAALDQAKLDLKRTTLRAPFDGEILRRDVSVGSQVSPGDPMGRIVGVDAYRVALTVAHSKLKWLSVAEDPEEKGSRVRVRNRGAWPEGVYRTGHLDRVVGALDDQTRMVRILVSIPDPLARAPETPDDAPELMIGEFLEARIRGKELENVVRLRRDHVRDGDTVWVMEKGKLAIRDVEVVARDERHAYISDGLRDGAKVVTTNLATITEGAKLRTEQASDSQGEAADASKSN
jgi:RND family efflux transporter MFP subunit